VKSSADGIMRSCCYWILRDQASFGLGFWIVSKVILWIGDADGVADCNVILLDIVKNGDNLKAKL
jgi:hypothetical protein